MPSMCEVCRADLEDGRWKSFGVMGAAYLHDIGFMRRRRNMEPSGPHKK